MGWPPEAGDSFPRAKDAWYTWDKVEDWILGDRGHGPEWARVFQIGLDDWGYLWQEILGATIGATIQSVRDRSPYGIACEAQVRISIGDRNALVKLSWHYVNEGDAPRLVTAYPTTL